MMRKSSSNSRVLRFKGLGNHIAQPDHIFAVNGCDPGVVTAVEPFEPVHRQSVGRQADGPGSNVPVDDTDAADLFGERQKLGAFTRNETAAGISMTT